MYDNKSPLALFSAAAAAAAGGRGLSSRPANALTLDEIQARENIEPQRQTHVRDDQTAFNKLVAVLQFSGAIDEASSSQQKVFFEVSLSLFLYDDSLS